MAPCESSFCAACHAPIAGTSVTVIRRGLGAHSATSGHVLGWRSGALSASVGSGMRPSAGRPVRLCAGRHVAANEVGTSLSPVRDFTG